MPIVNPTPIANTVIGTTDPCNICEGISLFGTGATPLPFGTHISYAMTDVQGTASLGGYVIQGRADVGFEAFFGICGPSWAFRANAAGNYGQSSTPGTNEIDLTITADDAQAGFVFGFDLKLTLEVNSYICVNGQCITPYKNSSLSLDFDVLGIALDLIQTVLESGALFEATAETLPSITKSWGAFANATGIVGNGGKLQLSPTFTVPINLWPLLVALDASSGTFSGAFVAADGVLKDLKGSLMIGPTIGVGVTSTIQITGLALDDVTLSGMSYDSGWVRLHCGAGNRRGFAGMTEFSAES